MKYEIKGNQLPVVVVTLDKGEIMHTEAGAMSWMSEGVVMKTNAGGSVGKAFSRLFSGESMFQNTYTASKDGDFIAFSSSFPGEIIAIDVSEKPIIAQKSALRGILLLRSLSSSFPAPKYSKRAMQAFVRSFCASFLYFVQNFKKYQFLTYSLQNGIKEAVGSVNIGIKRALLL